MTFPSKVIPWHDITVVVPAHSSRVRNGMLTRALSSVWNQTMRPRTVLVELDEEGQGAAKTRTRGLLSVETEWTAFLDSDDELLPRHIELLTKAVADDSADVAYPNFTVVGGTDPFRRAPNAAFDPGLLDTMNYIPVTTLVRTTRVLDVGGFHDRFDYEHGATCEEWNLWIALRDAGARFTHVPVVTWRWHHHDQNTGGRAGYGDAA